MTYGLFALANFVTYKLLKYKRNKESFLKSQKFKVAFGYFLSENAKLLQRIQKDFIYLEKNLANEKRLNGLIIIEAYYGLDEHIY